MRVRIPAWDGWSTPRQWFVTLRLLEVAALVLLAGTCSQLWSSWASTVAFDPFGGAPTSGEDIPLMSRVTSFVFFNDLRGAFVAFLVVAAVVALGVAVLLHQRPVENARLLRWELLALWASALLVALVVVGLHVLALFGEDPYQPSDEPTPVLPDDSYQPTMIVQLLSAAAWPVAGALVLLVSAVWWLRVPRDLESDDDGEEQGEGSLQESHEAGPSARQRRQADRDDVLLLEGVEQIEPVERLTPRESGGGDGTSSGYDDYLRRF